MIVFKRYGHTFKFRNDDWKALRARYDIKNAVYNKKDKEWRIKKDCTVCKRHIECKDCPFGCLGEFGCFAFVEKMFKKRKFDSSDRPWVKWENKDNDLVHKQLKRMQKIMDKIEEENK